jgi:hypothetical protein
MVLCPILPHHPARTITQRHHAEEDTLVGNQVERRASGTIWKFANIFNGITRFLRRTTSAQSKYIGTVRQCRKPNGMQQGSMSI